jgi:predicted lipid-binding transport protein (Tim44 family)
MTSVAAASGGGDGIAIPVPYQPLCTARWRARSPPSPPASTSSPKPADSPPTSSPPSSASGIMAVLMLGLHGGPAITSTVTLYAFFGYCLLVVAAILALRVLVLVFRPDTR